VLALQLCKCQKNIIEISGKVQGCVNITGVVHFSEPWFPKQDCSSAGHDDARLPKSLRGEQRKDMSHRFQNSVPKLIHPEITSPEVRRN